MRAKRVIVVQALIIILLFSLLLYFYFENRATTPENSLISPRIYAGLVEPKSYLIMNFVPLKKELQKYIENHNLTMSVYVVNLRNGASMSIHSYRPFTPASLSKVPVAILTMRKVEEDKLSLDTPLEIEEADRLNNSGELYQNPQKAIPLNILLKEMLQNSDNTAFKTLLHHLEKNDTDIIYTYWDYFSTDTTPESEQIYANGLITVRSVYNVFLSLYLSTVLEPEHSEYLLELMTHNIFDIKKIAQLPPEVTVAHKFAVYETSNVKVFHDCGILYIEEMRIFYCVMTEDLEQQQAIPHVAYALNTVYDYTVDFRHNLDTKFKQTPQDLD